MGGLKRLTVAVVVDGPYKEEAGDKGQITRTFTPRSAEEIRQLTEIVQRAVGFSQSRGDEVTMANVPFAITPTAGVPSGGKGWQDYLKEYAKPGINLVLVLAFLLLVARPLVNAYLSSRPAPAEAGRAGAPAAPAPAAWALARNCPAAWPTKRPCWRSRPSRASPPPASRSWPWWGKTPTAPPPSCGPGYANPKQPRIGPALGYNAGKPQAWLRQPSTRRS